MISQKRQRRDNKEGGSPDLRSGSESRVLRLGHDVAERAGDDGDEHVDEPLRAVSTCQSTTFAE